jgi:hypothetical protein
VTIDARFMTLSYNSQENKDHKHIMTSASQLRAEDDNSIVLIEYNQDKDISEETYASKNYTKYKIDAHKLISLIKEYGSEVD